jgi:hypothetical protein
MSIDSKLVLMSVALAASSSMALADGYVSMNQNSSNSPYSASNGLGGGAYTATAYSANGFSGYVGEVTGPRASAAAGSFTTFCLQVSEGFPNSDPPGPANGIYQARIREYTEGRGASNWDPASPGTAATTNPNRDYLSSNTAWIYSSFRNNNFGGFTGFAGLTTNQIGDALQLAIWYSEGELFSGTNGAGTRISANSRSSRWLGTSADAVAARALFEYANSIQHNGNLYGVRVLQLWAYDGTQGNGGFNAFAQDQLTIVPLPPAAYAGLGTLAGVIGLGYVRRRRLASI